MPGFLSLYRWKARVMGVTMYTTLLVSRFKMTTHFYACCGFVCSCLLHIGIAFMLQSHQFGVGHGYHLDEAVYVFRL